MKLVSRTEWLDLNLKGNSSSKCKNLADFHYKTSYYGEQGNLLGFSESFPNATGDMVSIYFIV